MLDSDDGRARNPARRCRQHLFQDSYIVLDLDYPYRENGKNTQDITTVAMRTHLAAANESAVGRYA